MDSDDFSQQMMQRALALAVRGRGRVEPNPMVGCVIVQDRTIVGEGYHRRYGRAHAEVNALAAAGVRAGGATVYVTLEPCSHHGKTPPCADALIAAGVSRVVVAMADPYPEVAGRGIARLREAGIPVDVGLLEAEALALNAPFVKRIRTGLPYLTGKWAATVDGCTATSTGHSRWISNAASRRWVHRLRARMDCIVVGVGTVLADDPQLTVREVKPLRPLRRVVIDPMLQMAETCRLMQSLDQAPLSVAVSEQLLDHPTTKVKAFVDAGVDLIAMPAVRDTDGLQQLAPVMRALVDRYDATHVLIEGGASTMGTAIRQRLVDELAVFVAPKVLGDGAGLPALRLGPAARRIEQMDLAEPLTLLQVKRLGEDVLLRYRLDRSAG